MVVPTGADALATLRRLLGEPDGGATTRDAPWVGTVPWHDEELRSRRPPDLTGIRHAPPEGDAWLWHHDQEELAGLRDASAYALPAPGGIDPETWARVLDHPVREVVDAAGRFDRLEQAYCARSVDLTMRGGTTSGVVYPNAVCELARTFRLRNVGGASAGAIAAAAAAAAELGRARIRAGAPQRPERSDADRREGRVRNGFAGLADTTAWLSELGLDGREHRVAQLFRPARGALPLFRLVAALMQPRGRVARFVVLLLTGLGPVGRWYAAGVVVLAPLLALGRWPYAGAGAGAVLVGWLGALLALLALSGGLVAVGTLLVGLLAPRVGSVPPADLAEPVLRPEPPPNRVPAIATDVGVLVAAALVGWLGVRTAAAAGAPLDAAWLLVAWGVGTAALVLVQTAGLAVRLLRAKELRFGLVAGSTTREQASRRRSWVWDRLAGLPSPTLEHAVVPWLSGLLTDLAGGADTQEPAVLRFGHLWCADYAWPPESRDDTQRAALSAAAADPRARSVNLELITSELVHQVPYRFPLSLDEQTAGPAERPTLFVRRADLVEVFPADVVEAVCPESGRVGFEVRSVDDPDAPVPDLYALPRPEDLPVVVAVRMSMSFPGLFQALRLYRLVASPEQGRHYVRDEYGARLQGELAGDGWVDLSYPGPQRDGPPTRPRVEDRPWVDDRHWMEELWLTDGGVTSNFPVHFFDTPLPLWPTLGINLGRHPAGFAHQDVWLPADDQARTSPPTPVGADIVGFLVAIFATARGWRDRYQTFMPAFRGRVAWVRERADEGGGNLFMTKETIASLAVRGAVAGRRLRRRFETEAYWKRHQWLRMRIALDNLDRLHARVRTALAEETYAALSAPPSEGDRLSDIVAAVAAAGGDPDPAVRDPDSPESPLPWFDEDVGDDFWAAASALLARYSQPPPDPLLHRGVPTPAPDLRQAPPV